MMCDISHSNKFQLNKANKEKHLKKPEKRKYLNDHNIGEQHIVFQAIMIKINFHHLQDYIMQSHMTSLLLFEKTFTEHTHFREAI